MFLLYLRASRASAIESGGAPGLMATALATLAEAGEVDGFCHRQPAGYGANATAKCWR